MELRKTKLTSEYFIYVDPHSKRYRDSVEMVMSLQGGGHGHKVYGEIGRASCRERVYVLV